MRRLAVHIAALVAWATLARGTSLATEDPRATVVSAMRLELNRSSKRLRLDGYETPYFIAYTVRDYDNYELSGKFGAIYSDQHSRSRHAYVEVRVGDYQLDNSSDAEESMVDIDAPESYEPSTDAPLDGDVEALRSSLWLLTDLKYKHALAAYAKKRGRRASTLVEDEKLPSFSKEAVAKATDPPALIQIDTAGWAVRIRRVGALFKHHPELFDGGIKLAADRMTRYFVSSEGTELVSERVIFSLYVTGVSRAPDGMLLEHEKSFFGRSEADLPDEATLGRTVDELASDLRGLRRAKVIDPYTGPAILMQQAAGVLFHEAVGHRLEGERQNNEKEGGTFKGQIGHQILPKFLSVYDDPTRVSAGPNPHSIPLNGHYRYDDEGVAARNVTLIEKGVLRDYLMSRTPIAGSSRSNGHGRAEGIADPMGRMANLIVQSTKRVSELKLKRMLLDEVRRQGKPFGLIIRDITGGSTNTANYGFQAFKGQPRLVYRVDAKTGDETLVRGVDLVGTPLVSINKIVATSDTEGVFNGFCGAESGFVPVSTVAPAVLMSEIELQRSQHVHERPLVLPPPWSSLEK